MAESRIVDPEHVRFDHYLLEEGNLPTGVQGRQRGRVQQGGGRLGPTGAGSVRRGENMTLSGQTNATKV